MQKNENNKKDFFRKKPVPGTGKNSAAISGRNIKLYQEKKTVDVHDTYLGSGMEERAGEEPPALFVFQE